MDLSNHTFTKGSVHLIILPNGTYIIEVVTKSGILGSGDPPTILLPANQVPIGPAFLLTDTDEDGILESNEPFTLRAKIVDNIFCWFINGVQIGPPIILPDGAITGVNSTTASNFIFGRTRALAVAGEIEVGVDDLNIVAGEGPCPTQDHALCYKAKTTPGTAKFQPRDVSLKDQFDTEPGTVNVKKPVSLCNPAEKTFEGNTEPINDPNTHLKGYKIKQEALHEPVTGITVKNQFHPDGLSVDTIKPDRLLVPTLKDLENPVTLPDPFEPNVDHFKCYKVKVTPGTAKLPKGIQASVKDQFNEVAKLFDIKKPSRLCNPVDKGGEGIKNEAAHLMCYKVKPATAHTPVTGIHTNNQFGPEVLDTIKEEELCVPSTKTLP